MNWRDIEEARRISKTLRDARRIDEELKNTRRIHKEVANNRNTLNDLYSSKNLINNRDELRKIREEQVFQNQLKIPISMKVRNEFLNSRHSLQKMFEHRNELNIPLIDSRKRLRNFDSIENQHFCPSQREIDRIKSEFLTSNNVIDKIRSDYISNERRINKRRNDYVNMIPKWQEQILPALAVRRSEIDDVVNNRELLRNQLDFIPNNFRDQRFWNEINSLRDTYVGNLAVSMRKAIVDSDNKDEASEKIESLFEEKVSVLPKNKISREFILGLFVTFILSISSMWYSHYLSENSSVELETFFRETFKKLEKIEKSISNNEIFEENDDTYYVVQRTALVKNNPKFKSLTIDYLSPNTKVRLLRSKHKWIYIEYIDYLEVIPRYGWVSKKYLKRTK